MKKKKRSTRRWVGKAHLPEIWIPEDEIDEELDFVKKLHPDRSMDDVIADLERLGFISVRTTPADKREFRFNQKNVQEAINELPPEKRRGREIKIYEDTAMICDYNNEATTLLSVIIQQTDQLKEMDTVPWIIKTSDQIADDMLGTSQYLAPAFSFLEMKNFVEITEWGSPYYRYRLNVSVVQSALDALPPS